MKRPLAITGFSSLAAMLCLIHCENTLVSLCLLSFSLIAVLICIITKFKKALPFAMAFIGIGLACFLFLVAEFERRTTLSLCGDNVKVEAVVTQEADFDKEKERFYAVAKLESINGKKAYGKIRLSFNKIYDQVDNKELKVGNRLSFEAKVYKIGESSGDIHKYYCSTGIYTGCYGIKNLTVQQPRIKPLNYYISVIRNTMVGNLKTSLDSKSQGLAIGLLTADKKYISDEIYSALKISGAAHIMAVSGMHLSVWILFLGFLVDKLTKRKLPKLIILSSAVVFIIFLASFSPSVMRAGIMMLLYLFGKFLGRETDGLNSLGFAAIVLLIINPYVAVSVGIQLSFLSVASIFIIASPASKLIEERFIPYLPTQPLKRLATAVITSILISISVTLFTFPVSVLAFGGASTVSVLTNLLLLPVVTPFTVLSGLLSVFSFIPFLSPLLKIAVKYGAAYVLSVTEMVSEIPNSYISVSFGFFIVLSVLFSLIVIFAFAFIKKRSFLAILTLFSVVSALSFACLNEFSNSLTSFRIIPVATENNCAYIVSMNGRGVLVGANDDYYFSQSVADTLEKFNISLDAVLLSRQEYFYEAEFISAEHGARYMLTCEGESITLFGEVEIVCTSYGAAVTGNEFTAQIFSQDYLQEDNNCDIILNNYGVLFPQSETAPYEYAEYSQDTAKYSIVVNEKGEYSFGG